MQSFLGLGLQLVDQLLTIESVQRNAGFINS